MPALNYHLLTLSIKICQFTIVIMWIELKPTRKMLLQINLNLMNCTLYVCTDSVCT